MIINQINVSTNNSTKRHQAQSFGQINPVHLFIDAKGYEKNQDWAVHVIHLIERSKELINKNTKFKETIGFIANEYGAFFKNNKKPLSNISNSSDCIYFGKPRTKNERYFYTHISQKNRYAPYVKRMINKLKKEGETGFMGRRLVDYFQYTMPNSSFLNKKKLHSITFIKSGLDTVEQEAVGKYLIKIESPSEKVIPKIFKRIEKIYNKILNNNENLSKENIDVITKDVAKIHWYLSQATPYVRGSAGITDAFCKTLFEAKGIQVSPYKKKLDPNMEAYVLSYDEYINQYKNFFTSPLSRIKQS